MIWQKDWRQKTWDNLESTAWDLIIIGGGITGAGILREAAGAGLRALLVEQRDFAWGTSSRSSKLVHGGLRYLKQGELGLMWASVKERELLLKSAPGLVEPLGFLLVNRRGGRLERWMFEAGLTIYDVMARRWTHEYHSAQEFHMLAPNLGREGLAGGFRYEDALTDDARLVLHVLQSGFQAGGTAINYVRAAELLREDDRVCGVRLVDAETGAEASPRARVVINATGAWADKLHPGQQQIRPLRGSHLVFHHWRLPAPQAVSFTHPLDGRFVFVIPWEGATLVGTTDIDHPHPLDEEPAISPDEVAYLMAALEHEYPALGLTLDDVVATFAGVRPVLDTGQEDPSKESRDHVLWQQPGLVTVTGGKLTTFRRIALDVLHSLNEEMPDLAPREEESPLLEQPQTPAAPGIPPMLLRRLLGRYGPAAADLIAAAAPGELETIPDTATVWAELRWAARCEAVLHLDDLLLRRTRLGLLLPGGGAAHMARFRAICQPELGWDDTRWQQEEAAYRALWARAYSLPPRETIPDWQAALDEVWVRRRLQRARKLRRRRVRRAAVLTGLALLLVSRLWRRKNSPSRP